MIFRNYAKKFEGFKPELEDFSKSNVF